MDFWRFKCCPFATLILSFLYMLNFSTCSSLNEEGIALLRFKQKLASDPFRALSNWREEIGVENPCSWFGVECLEGHVVSLNLKDLCLKGMLPSEIGELVHIKSLILRNNSFSGAVPEEIFNLEELEVLDIGYNDFSGELQNYFKLGIGLPVDEGLLLPSCNELSISWNSGETKGNVMRRKSLQEHLANKPARKFFLTPVAIAPDLPPLASPLSPSPAEPGPADLPPPASPLPSFAPAPASLADSPSPHSNTPMERPLPNPAGGRSQPPKSSRENNHQLLIILSASGGSLLFLLVLGVIIWQCANVATVKPWATGLSGQLQRAFVTGVPKLRRSELQAACEYFSNVIGSSPFWSLYKGTLSNGTEIAVASIAVASAKDWSSSLESRFRNKISTLSKVNHKNFASLLGYCVEEEPFTRMMVFEYAPNGTLFEHLHIREAEHLDWVTRLRIAMGIAYCLEHMHQLNPPFVHISFNSSAVYLTEDYAAKVSDFTFFGEASSSEAQPNLSSNVHRFGMVLLEMMTGRLLYAAGSDSLEDWASNYITGEQTLREMVDPTLETWNEDQLQQIDDVIRSCANTDARQRPAMQEVCMMLREVTRIDPDGAAPRLSPLWWAEVEIMSGADAS